MALESFIEASWNDHADDPEGVASRLAAAVPRASSGEDVGALARIISHVYGEHLGRWDDGVAMLRSLPAVESGDAAAAAQAITRGVAMLRWAGGDVTAVEALSREDRAAVLASAASALTGRQAFKRALDAYAQALEIGARAAEADRSVARALAVGGNNLAAALEEKPDRDEDETYGMVTAAEGGLRFWKLAGGWLEEERAHYRLARSLLAAGRPSDALRHAKLCAEVCANNHAPVLEQFFAHAVSSVAYKAVGDADAAQGARRAALEAYEGIGADEKAYCQSDLRELG
jgi:tetratricopeptide (TPR) repeat protein